MLDLTEQDKYRDEEASVEFLGRIMRITNFDGNYKQLLFLRLPFNFNANASPDSPFVLREICPLQR